MTINVSLFYAWRDKTEKKSCKLVGKSLKNYYLCVILGRSLIPCFETFEFN